MRVTILEYKARLLCYAIKEACPEKYCEADDDSLIGQAWMESYDKAYASWCATRDLAGQLRLKAELTVEIDDAAIEEAEQFLSGRKAPCRGEPEKTCVPVGISDGDDSRG